MFANINRFGRSSWGASSENDGIASLAFGVVMAAGMLVIIVLTIAIWAIFKAVQQVVRGWRQSDGKSLPLRNALWTWIGLLVAGLVCGLVTLDGFIPRDAGATAAGVLGVVWIVASVVLFIVARKTEYKYRRSFADPPETLVTKMFHHGWWPASTPYVA